MFICKSRVLILQQFCDLGIRNKILTRVNMTVAQPRDFLKGGFFSERADPFVISPNRRTKLFSWAIILIFVHSKWLKSCQIGTWSCSECTNKALERLQVLISHDLSHLEWKKFKILAQENNLVHQPFLNKSHL